VEEKFPLAISSGGYQIDDSHDSYAIAYVLSVFWFTFDTGPYVVFLDRERVAIAMIHPHFTLEAEANHVVLHGVTLFRCFRL